MLKAEKRWKGFVILLFFWILQTMTVAVVHLESLESPN